MRKNTDSHLKTRTITLKKVTFAVRTEKKRKQEKERISDKKKKCKKNMCVVRIGLTHVL